MRVIAEQNRAWDNGTTNGLIDISNWLGFRSKINFTLYFRLIARLCHTHKYNVRLCALSFSFISLLLHESRNCQHFLCSNFKLWIPSELFSNITQTLFLRCVIKQSVKLHGSMENIVCIITKLPPTFPVRHQFANKFNFKPLSAFYRISGWSTWIYTFYEPETRPALKEYSN